MRELGGDDLEHKIPVERCFDWEILALVELARGRPEAAEAYARRAEENAARLGLRPAGGARAARARRRPARRRASRAAAARAARGGGRRGRGGRRAAAGRLRAQPARAGRSPPPGERDEAIAALREAERELDACGSRPRARRDAPRAAQARRARRAARAGDRRRLAASASLTKRELEIAELVTDRHDQPRDRRRRSSSARRRSSRTCATSSSSSACPRASRSRAPSSASGASGGVTGR